MNKTLEMQNLALAFDRRARIYLDGARAVVCATAYPTERDMAALRLATIIKQAAEAALDAAYAAHRHATRNKSTGV